MPSQCVPQARREKLQILDNTQLSQLSKYERAVGASKPKAVADGHVNRLVLSFERHKVEIGPDIWSLEVPGGRDHALKVIVRTLKTPASPVWLRSSPLQ